VQIAATQVAVEKTASALRIASVVEDQVSFSFFSLNKIVASVGPNYL